VCAFMFTMPVAGEITNGETELSALVEALREANPMEMERRWSQRFPRFGPS
jgi:ribonuclease HI